jgi:hypothetical protein
LLNCKTSFDESHAPIFFVVEIMVLILIHDLKTTRAKQL